MAESWQGRGATIGGEGGKFARQAQTFAISGLGRHAPTFGHGIEDGLGTIDRHQHGQIDHAGDIGARLIGVQPHSKSIAAASQQGLDLTEDAAETRIGAAVQAGR